MLKRVTRALTKSNLSVHTLVLEIIPKKQLEGEEAA
jgi:hypothetical protein